MTSTDKKILEDIIAILHGAMMLLRELIKENEEAK